MTEPLSDLERVMAQFRGDVLRRERQAAVEMVRQYGGIWQRLKRELAALEQAIAHARDAGEQVDVAWLLRQERYDALLEQVERELGGFSRDVGEQIARQQLEAVGLAEQHAEALVRVTLGPLPEAAQRAGVVLAWHRLPSAPLREMIAATRPGSPLEALLASLSTDGAARARSVLIEALALGRNPRHTARELRRALSVPLNRALTISRTETLRAYREATRESYRANDDVVKGWTWRAALDERTCAMCWAMHGTRHRLDETLDDHPNGRCAMQPITLTWAEIGAKHGIDMGDMPVREPEPTGAELFERQPEDVQRRVLGPAGYEAYQAGQVELGDYVGRKRSRAWGTMRYARPLKAIIGDQAES